MSTKNLDTLFNPENIAVVGASNNQSKAGFVIVQNLLNIGYPKKVFPVNKNEDKIQGLKSYKSIQEIPEKIELLVLITPSKYIYEIMEDLKKRMEQKGDVKAIVCAAAGYAETDTREGIKRQKILMETAKEYNIRVMGPNCIGVIDKYNKVDTTFVETHLSHQKKGKPGGISFISQSGAMAASILMKGDSQPVPMEFNKFVSIGNMADVDFIDLLNYMEKDENTKVIGLYMEGYPEAKKLVKTMERIAKKKPIIVLKVGKSKKGASAANSHTGSLAGSDKIYDSAFKQFGIIRVHTIDELINTMQAFDKLNLPKDENLFILSQAGGPGIYCTDEISNYNYIKMTDIEAQSKNELKKILPPMASVCKPEGYVDITAAADVKQHCESLKILLEDENVSSVIFITVIPTFLDQEKLAKALVRTYNKYEGKRKPIYPVIMAGEYVKGARKILESNGIYSFETPDQAAKVAANLINYSLSQNKKSKKGDREDALK